MNRRDFAKTTATGLGGLLAMLVPGKAAGKVKPKFPRYFVHRMGPFLRRVPKRYPYPGPLFGNTLYALGYVRVDGPEQVRAVWQDCSEDAPHLTLAVCEKRARCGGWREVTAAEAEALTGEWVALKDVRKKGYGWFVKDCFSPKTT